MAIVIGIAAAVIIAALVWVFVLANGARTRGDTFEAEAKTNPAPSSRTQSESPRAGGLD